MIQNETKTVLLLSTSVYLVGKPVDCLRKKSYLYSASLLRVKLTGSGNTSFITITTKTLKRFLVFF